MRGASIPNKNAEIGPISVSKSLLDPGIELSSPHWQGGFFITEGLMGNPHITTGNY